MGTGLPKGKYIVFIAQARKITDTNIAFLPYAGIYPEISLSGGDATVSTLRNAYDGRITFVDVKEPTYITCSTNGWDNTYSELNMQIVKVE